RVEQVARRAAALHLSHEIRYVAIDELVTILVRHQASDVRKVVIVICSYVERSCGCRALVEDSGDVVGDNLRGQETNLILRGDGDAFINHEGQQANDDIVAAGDAVS